MAELCLEAGKKNLAIMAIKKEKVYEHKIQMLIDAEAWVEACEEAFTKKTHGEFEGFIEMIRDKGPPFVEDFIKEQQNKKK